MYRKYGSFDVEIDYYAENGKNTQTHTVSPLSQQELASGWRLVLPKKKIASKSLQKYGFAIYVKNMNDTLNIINTIARNLPPKISKCFKGFVIKINVLLGKTMAFYNLY